MSGQEIVLAMMILAAASLVQALAGFGFALLSMPLLSVVIGTTPALAVVTLLAVVNSGATAMAERGVADMGSVKRQTVSAFVGMPLGLFLLEELPERDMQMLIALSVAVAAVTLALRVRLPPVGNRIEMAAGLTSGALATSTGTSGPPVVICLQSRGMAAAKMRATLATMFLATGWVSVVLLSLRGHINADDLLLAALALPALLASWWIGARFFARITQHHYDAVVVVLLLGASAVAMVKAL